MNQRESSMNTPAASGRELGFWMCTALVVGNVIGIGIFMLPASLAPYGYNGLLGWAVTIAGCIALARVFARLAREFPNADGPYGYIQRNLGDGPAFFSIWCYWVSLWITNAALTVGVVGYLTVSVPVFATVPPVGLALALLWLFVGINLLGARTGGGVQVLTAVLKLVPMVVVIGLGAWMLLTDAGSFGRHPVVAPITGGNILAASTIALFAMLGLESATVPAGKVRDPERTIPRATLVGTLLAGSIYFVVSALPLLVLPQDQLARSNAPFVELIDLWLGAGSGRWLGLFVVISGIGCLNGWTMLVGELTRSMALQGVMPRQLAEHNRHGAPATALLATGALASAMVLMNYSKSMAEGFTFLSAVVTAANLPMYLLCALALVQMWRRRVAVVGSDLAVLGGLGCAYAIFAFVGLGSEPFLWAMVLAAAGVPVFVLMRRRLPPGTPTLTAAKVP